MKKSVPIKRVFISTYDSRNLTDLVAGLLDVCPDIEILSTGLTHSHLLQFLGPERAANCLQSIEEFTGQVAVEAGVPRTLDWRIALGILFNEEKHRSLVEKYGIQPIDLIVCNVQPFNLAATRADGTIEAACQLIEIERPNLIRLAVRALHRVTVLISPDQYPDFVATLRQNHGETDVVDRARLAVSGLALLRQIDQDAVKYLSNLVQANQAATFINFINNDAAIAAPKTAAAPMPEPVATKEKAELPPPEEKLLDGDTPLKDFKDLAEKIPEATNEIGSSEDDTVDPDDL